MDANSMVDSITYRKTVSVSFLLSRPNAWCSSKIEWEVRQWSVAFSLKKSNVLTNGTSAGSIAILVRNDVLGVKYGVNGSSSSGL